MGVIRILERTARALEMPLEVVTGCAEMSLLGNREFRMEGYQGLLEYSDTLVRISAGRTAVSVKGENLEIKSISTGQITVCGSIFSVDFQ